MVQQLPKTIIDLIAEQIERDEGETAYKVNPMKDRIKFGFPEEMVKMTLGEQIKQNMVPIGQHTQPSKVKPNEVKRMQEEGSKQLKLPASSTIQQAAYWPRKEYLVVSFKSGHTYSYDKVPLRTIITWEEASSAGSWFYYNIRMNFQYKKQG